MSKYYGLNETHSKTLSHVETPGKNPGTNLQREKNSLRKSEERDDLS